MTRSRRPTPFFAVALVAAVAASARAETFKESFDGDATSWRAEYDRKVVRPFDHRRQQHLLKEGKGAEVFKAEVRPPGGEVQFAHPLKPAVAIPDVRLSVWVKSNQPGLELRMRLVFPEATDPETGRSAFAFLKGDRYTQTGEWQQLTCAASQEAVQGAARLTRAKLSQPQLSDRGLYVDQAVVWASFTPEPAEVLFDDLTFGPIVEPPKPGELLSVGMDVAQPDAPVEFRLSRLRVEGEPFFPRMMAFHPESGEGVADLAGAGVNVAWVRDYRDDTLLASLREAGLWATATPPRATGDDGAPLDPGAAGLLPFGAETRPILFWNLESRVDPKYLDELIGWVNQLRAADAAFHRPTLADVKGSEYAFSRHVDMLASSRLIANTAFSYTDYRDWLQSRRSGAFLNTFYWTWIQTEPTQSVVKAREAGGQLPVVIEPEQIRQQVYAALQAGCRGLAYWKETPLNGDGPGAEERRLALARLNIELSMLEPLLATGDRRSAPIDFGVTRPKPGSDGRRTRPGYDPLTITGPRAGDTPFARSERPPGGGQAVLVKTELGPLLLAVWYGESAQFCPGQMAANDLTIVVPGVDETAAAWLLTPTGVEHLREKRVAGGKMITLPKFDQTAAVLFTSDRAAVDRLSRRAAELSSPCAEASVALARAKYQRVASVHNQLAAMGVAPKDSGPALRKAESLIAQAEKGLAEQRNFDAVRDSADDALQELRILQRMHWEDAVAQFPSPLASPHTVCFSTLPDHYRLIGKIGRAVMTASEDPNLLPSGDFEELSDGWRRTDGYSDATLTDAALKPVAKGGGYSLCLATRRREGVTATPRSDGNYVVVESPPIPVTAGQVLHVSGFVRIDQPIPSHLDGAMLHDNILGPSSGLRWTSTRGWQQFELLREIPGDGDFTLTLALHANGDQDVFFDKLRVVALTPREKVAVQPPTTRRTARQ
jgi:hypothetical protein